ncbi:hypothetical protein PQO03_00040 [Lentisphaera profundi]|uniref:Uncharacterized protein n=1 Tax=Lentisphaera profundi TaxID=1658616 RepID=A0ABY7VTY6_9BACT|nr:hypothetical protein [Lentisphaera profundi]WDE96357.1 hypothetical protein PQO03_00040 [Lentisphaera profundi]
MHQAKASSFRANVYKKLALNDPKYIQDFFDEALQSNFSFYDDDTKRILNALAEGQLTVSKESQWILLFHLNERRSSSQCKFSHILLQDIYQHKFESKDAYKDSEKIFNAFYPLWLKQE